MDNRKNINLGSEGERIVNMYLQRKNILIRETNYHCRYGEIDLIGECNNTLIFFEVKTRSKGSIKEVVESVDKTKQAKIIKSAHHYLQENPYDGDMRFDVIGLLKKGSDYIIEHIENAFFVNDDFH